MKFKHIMNLQLFADDPTSASAEGELSARVTTTQTTQTPQAQQSNSGNDDKPKYTDKDLDDIISKKFAKWQEKQQKAVDEAKKLAEMNATQKAEYERDQLQKELDGYKKKDALAEMTKTARKMLSESHISIPEELLSMMVNDNAEETKAAVDGFAKAFTDAVENAVKERLKGEPPKRGTGSGKTEMTKEQIMSIQDPELRQQKMLEHRDLFNF